ncbi:TIGR01620 family protein [Pseudoalteromonas luteoviolacea]|uniref:TIGR01620 family protein n=1 Tax=Pseudoalteromonas luteoviolacea TaxID=43657 RepID=A0A1C0TK42_9GAMM|nr:TIGR01620 family protein [Pseudoalteromonas luteoviolacea]OCQ18902.1 TIGR01620 family protein [Pseudoalteromonas luteoviolacea]
MTKSKQWQAGRRIDTQASSDEVLQTQKFNRQSARLEDEQASFSTEDINVLSRQANDEQIESSFEASSSHFGWRHILLFSLMVLIPIEMAMAIYTAFQQSIILAGIYTLCVVSALGWGGQFLIKEVLALRTLKNLEIRREQASRLLSSNQIGEAQSWLEPIFKKLPKGTVDEFQASLKSHYTDKEVLQLYEQSVLKTQDDAARAIISEYATTSALMVALSPMAITDMLAVLWRGVSLIEKLSKHYGVELGYRSRIKLYKLLAKQIVFVGATELLSDLAATSLGAELLGKLSARSAQGLSAGVFTARLGYKAMEICRPIPRLENKANFLTTFAKKLTNQLLKQN